MFAPQGIEHYGGGETGDIPPGPYNYVLRGMGLGNSPEWQDISMIIASDPDNEVDGGDADPTDDVPITTGTIDGGDADDYFA